MKQVGTRKRGVFFTWPKSGKKIAQAFTFSTIYTILENMVSNEIKILCNNECQ